jgi:TonB family protein
LENYDGEKKLKSVELVNLETMRAKNLKYAAGASLLLAMAFGTLQLRAQSSRPAEAKRPAKHLVQPNLSDLARKLNLSGTVRIEVTIAPDGNVKRTRVLGGHPVLAADAERAAQNSTFEPASTETVEVIEFKF